MWAVSNASVCVGEVCGWACVGAWCSACLFARAAPSRRHVAAWLERCCPPSCHSTGSIPGTRCRPAFTSMSPVAYAVAPVQSCQPGGRRVVYMSRRVALSNGASSDREARHGGAVCQAGGCSGLRSGMRLMRQVTSPRRHAATAASTPLCSTRLFTVCAFMRAAASRRCVLRPKECSTRGVTLEVIRRREEAVTHVILSASSHGRRMSP